LEAIELAPQFVEASEALAEMNRTFKGNPAESVRVLVSALRRYPGRPSLFLALGEVTIASGDLKSARWILNRLLASGAADGETQQAAKELLAKVAPGDEKALFAFTIDEPGSHIEERSVRYRTNSPDQPETEFEALENVSVESASGVMVETQCDDGQKLTVWILLKNVKTPLKLRTNNFQLIERIDENRQPINWRCVTSGTRLLKLNVNVTYRVAPVGNIAGEILTMQWLGLDR
jgi:hypothetical protein